jgi:hypothetical protein
MPMRERKHRVDLADAEHKTIRAADMLGAAHEELRAVLRRAGIEHRAAADLEEARRAALVASHQLSLLAKAFANAEHARKKP